MGGVRGRWKGLVGASCGVLAIGAICSSPATAWATGLPSTISSNMTLTKAGSPYTGGTTIEAGVTVTAEPGAEVREGYGTPINVNGTLKVEGTSEDPVVFTSESGEGYFAWAGLVFKPGSGSSVLEHAVVRYAGQGSSPAIEIKKSSPTIEHSVIRDDNYGGIRMPEGGSPEIAHNTFINTGGFGAVYYNSNEESSGEVNIHDNTIEGGYDSGIAVYESGPVVGASVGGNLVKGTTGVDAAIRYTGDEIPADLDENTLEENKVNAMSVGGTVSKSATWTDHGYPFLLDGELTVGSKATLNLGPGFTTKSSFWPLTVNGTLKAEGTGEDPVLFTSQKEDAYFNWMGLVFKPGSGASVLDHAAVRYVGRYGYWAAGIEVKKSSPTIEHSTISNNNYGGIYIPEGGSPEIADNTFLYNGGSAAVYYNSNEESSGEVNIHDNTIKGGYDSGIAVYASGSVKGTSLGGNTVEGAEGVDAAIRYGGAEIPADLDENTLKENKINAIAISGTIKKSMTWTDHGYPFLLEYDVTVGPEATLSIGPGFTIKSQSWWSILVKGTLKAEGSPGKPVLFTTSTGYNWPGIFFEPGSGASVLDEVEVAKAGKAWGSAIQIEESSPRITHSVIRESTNLGILVMSGGSPEIDHNTITHSGTGIYYATAEGNPGAIDIHDNVLEYGYGTGAAIYVSASGSWGENVEPISLGDNTISYGQGNGISYEGGEIPPDIDDNDLVSNKEDTITLSGVLGQSATWTDHGFPIVVLSSGLEIASPATLTATQGLAIQGGGPITVDGTLNAEGSEDAPVAFEPRGSEKWSGLIFEPGSGASLLDYAEVVKAGYSGWSSAPAITINKSSPTIENSMLRENPYQAIFVKEGSPTIESNLFRGNPYGLIYEGEGTLSAPNNDWQCNPESKSCGNLVSENVEWKPTASLEERKRPCVPGSAHPGPRKDCLLYRYQPEMKLTDDENFHPSSAAMILENWGNENGLWSEWKAGGEYGNELWNMDPPGEWLSEAGPGFHGGAHLDLSALGSIYPGGKREASDNDWIDEVNPPGQGYAGVAEGLEGRGYADHAYGILINEGGKIWLQYWYFYYYDDFGYAALGEHEGDWESVEIGLDEDLKPEVFVYSQHKRAVKCYVEDEEADVTEGGAPIVYVARGSHANYPEAGEYLTEVSFNPDEAWGKGDTVKPRLENLGRTQPSWLEWPGHWGGSYASNELESDSPTGPAFGHEQWSSPEGYADGAEDCRRGNTEDEEVERGHG